MSALVGKQEWDWSWKGDSIEAEKFSSPERSRGDILLGVQERGFAEKQDQGSEVSLPSFSWISHIDLCHFLFFFFFP